MNGDVTREWLSDEFRAIGVKLDEHGNRLTRIETRLEDGFMDPSLCEERSGALERRSGELCRFKWWILGLGASALVAACGSILAR